MPESGFVAEKKHGLADINFILTAGENERLCVPGMSRVEPSTWLPSPEGSPSMASTLTPTHTWGGGGEGGCELPAAGSGG